MQTAAHFIKLFWSKVRKGPGCWLWQAGLTKAGYGQTSANKAAYLLVQGKPKENHNRPILAHRVSWALKHGPIPDGLHALHKCDTPACVNPKHLFLGTQHDNNIDRDRKGRVASGDRNGSRTKPQSNPFVKNGGSRLHGERHPMAKLSLVELKELLRLFDTGKYSKAVLARRFGISEAHTHGLIRRRGWKHKKV